MIPYGQKRPTGYAPADYVAPLATEERHTLLRIWMENNDLTAASFAKLCDIRKGRLKRIIDGDSMSPEEEDKIRQAMNNYQKPPPAKPRA